MRALAACVVVLAVLAVATSSAATELPTFAIEPAWSPNGKLIAFVDTRPGGGNLSDLYVMNADGSNIRRVTNGRELGQPSWSPDSKRLAFNSVSRTSSGLGHTGIAVMNADGTGFHEIVHVGGGPSWSPGGRQIAFSLGSGEDQPFRIYAVNPDGTNRTLAAEYMTDFDVSVASPTWSPDGQRLAFGIGGQGSGIGMVKSYGGHVTVLSRKPLAGDLDWSPGGRKIAYTAYQWTAPYKTIDVLDLKTGRRTTLHTGMHPSWSPNSRRIIFSDGAAIYVMSADGTEVSKLFPR